MIRVLVVDDHAIVRHGIHALLETELDIQVVGEAQDGQQAIAEAQRLRPDVVLMDLVMPGVDGVEAIRRIRACQPEARVLVLTSFGGDDKVFPAIKAGALGYLLKDSAPCDLVQAIRQVYRGESALHPIIALKLVQELAHPQGAERAAGGSTADAQRLTRRELEVLQSVAVGQTDREIAGRLGISEATVRTHMSNILAKLHVLSRTQAAVYALREGLATLASAGGSPCP
jgi:NarL family two-component system response regulator LiaR